MLASEPAPAKLNLALHVLGRLAGGRHALDTLFAFCIDGDRISGEVADRLSLEIVGPFAEALGPGEENLVIRAAKALQERGGIDRGARLRLHKALPVAAGIGGGSADAAAALRLLVRLWDLDPAIAAEVAPELGADVPACLLSMTARGSGAGDRLELVGDPRICGRPVLLVNPGVALSTADVFAAWRGPGSGPLDDWERGANDLEPAARGLVPEIGDVLDWLAARPGTRLARMSGSGATCFALFDDEDSRDAAAAACPSNWWNLASFLR